MTEKISAVVYWEGHSNSSDGEHSYDMEFVALPRIGDHIEVGRETVQVTKVLFTERGFARIYTKGVKE